MSSDDLIEIGALGFFLPLLSLLISMFFYALMLLMNSFGLPTGSKFEMPGYAYVALVGITIILMNYGGYIKDFTNGIEYPKRALIYGMCALVGLEIFWKPVGGISQGGMGQGAIISSIITIILSFGGAAVSYYYGKKVKQF